MKAWFAGLEDRERFLATAGGVVLLVFLAAFFVWMPLNERREALAARVDAQAGTLAWMREAQQRVLDARRQPGDAAERDGRSLLALIDTTAREHELGDRLRRAEPSGDDGVRVWFEDVRFTGLAAWMEALGGRYGLVFTGFSIDRAGTGRVNARLTVAVPGDAWAE